MARHRLAILAGVALALLYAWTVAPTFGAGDSAELAAAAAEFGVPHPPGYPLYTLATGLLVRGMVGVDPALAANLASGVWAGAALGLFVALGLRLGSTGSASLVGAATLGLGATFWSQATVAEVYTFDLLLAAAALHALLTAARGAARPWAWVALGAAVGAWWGHRPVNVLALPGLAFLFAAWRSGGSAGAGRSLRLAGCGALGSAVVFAYLPLASSAEPAIDVGDPQTWSRFLAVVRASPYTRHLDGAHALENLARFFASLPLELGIATLLAPVGALAGWRAGERARLEVVGLSLWAGAGLAFASQYSILDVEVTFLPTFAALALLGVRGAEALVVRSARLAAPLVALSLAGLFALDARDRGDQTLPRAFGEALLEPLPEGALLLADGDSTIHALWYLQAVEGLRSDVVVLSLGHRTAWHHAQLEARHPDAPWPARAPGRPPADHAGRIVDAFAAEGRVAHLTLSVPPDGVLRHAAGEYGSVPRGLTAALLPRGTELSVTELVASNVAFFGRHADALRPPRHPDPDMRSMLLQVALAASRTAELCERADRPGALETWRFVLALEPDAHEAFLAREAARAGSASPPRLGLAERARRAVAGDRGE